jgi:hypothetical protein
VRDFATVLADPALNQGVAQAGSVVRALPDDRPQARPSAAGAIIQSSPHLERSNA